ELVRVATDEVRSPFDLVRGPLLRIVLYPLHEGVWVGVFTLHHIISDGWSAVVFVREIAALYEAFSASRPSPLPALPIQYADYAAWQRGYLAGEYLETQLAYWRERLSGSTGLELPGDRPRPAVETFRGRNRAVGLPATVTAALHDLCRREG